MNRSGGRGGTGAWVGIISFAATMIAAGATAAGATAATPATQAHRLRWELLPESVRRVVVDRGGRAWISRDGSADGREAALRRSVEQAWADKESVLASVRVLTRDRGGVLWVLPVISPEFTLYGYDGKTWVRREVDDVPRQPPILAARARDETPRPLFSRDQFAEDDAGNFFISDGRGVHRRAADGAWDYLSTGGDAPSVYEGLKSRVSPAVTPPGMRPQPATRMANVVESASGKPALVWPPPPPAVDPNPHHSDLQYTSPLQVLRGADGTVWAFDRSYRDRAGKPGVWRFDPAAKAAGVAAGKGRWVQADPATGLTCTGASGKGIDCFIPLADGSFVIDRGYIPANNGVREAGAEAFDGMRFWRPDGQQFPQLAKLLRGLADDEFSKREAAGEAILALGPAVAPQLRVALERGQDAEVRGRLQRILGRYDSEPGMNGRPPGQRPKIPYGGHLTFRQPVLVLRRASGEALFEVSDCEDLLTHATWERALVTVHTDGRWEAGPTPWGPHRSAAAGLVEDAKGGIWFGNYRVEGNKLTQPVPADLFVFSHVVGPDRDGKLYLGLFDNYYAGLWMVFDEAVPATEDKTPRLKARDWRAQGAVVRGPDGAMWAMISADQHTDDEYWATTTTRRRDSLGDWCSWKDGAWRPCPGLPSRLFTHLTPLKDGGFVGVQQDYGGQRGGVFYFDGTTLHPAPDLKTLVETNLDALRRRIDPARSMAPYCGVAVDAAGDVWVTYRQKLDRYDGKAWHNLIDELPYEGKTLPRVGHVRMFDGGKSVFVVEVVGNHGWVLTRKPGNGWNMTPVPIAVDINPYWGRPIFVDDADGGVWAASSGERAIFLKDGTAKAVNGVGKPQMVDSKGRVWFVESGVNWLQVQQGNVKGMMSYPEPQGLTFGAGVIESPDGRIWLTTSHGLREVRVGREGAKFTVELKGSWLGWPLGFAAAPTGCEAGALWVSMSPSPTEGGMIHRRLELPAP